MGDSLRSSVALCTYNGERYIAKQLWSIANQTLLPNELVICDDCSADSTVSVIRDFIASAPFKVRLKINENTMGSTKNFEQALGLCEGDIIVLSDQDDAWYSHRMEMTVAAFAANPRVGVVFGDADIAYANLALSGRRLWAEIHFGTRLKRLLDNGRAFEALLAYNFVTGATAAFRAQYRSLVLPIPTRWIHDGWIAILISAVADVLPINKPLIKYRQHDCQQIGAKSRGTIQQLARTLASSNLQRYIQAYEQYIEVSKRLDAAGLSPFDASLLREKIDHMNRRSALRKSRLSRMPTIAEELLSLRYRRFGYGMRSAARDLLVNLDGEPEQQLASL